jgi:hypothetical protein
MSDQECRCGVFVTEHDLITRVHKVDGLTVHLDRCKCCAGESLCKSNIYGEHGEVYTPHDDGYRADRMTIDGTVLEPPNGDRFGYCSRCYKGLYWDAQLHRWRDLTWLDVATEWEKE